MAQVVATTGGSQLVKWIGGKLGDKVASYAFTKGLESIMGSDTEKLSKQIETVLKGIAEVKTAVDNLSKQLSSSITNLRKDFLKEPAGKIETTYHNIQDILEKLVKVLSQKQSPEKMQEDLKNLQNNLQSGLSALHTSDGVPGWLDRMNQFLDGTSDSSIVKEVADQAFSESKDFVNFYLRVKTFVRPECSC